MSKRPVHVLRKGNSSEDDNDSKRPALPSPPADTTAAMSKAALYEQATAKLFKSSDVPTKLISSIYTSSDAALAEGVMSVTFGTLVMHGEKATARMTTRANYSTNYTRHIIRI